MHQGETFDIALVLPFESLDKDALFNSLKVFTGSEDISYGTKGCFSADFKILGSQPYVLQYYFNEEIKGELFIHSEGVTTVEQVDTPYDYAICVIGVFNSNLIRQGKIEEDLENLLKDVSELIIGSGCAVCVGGYSAFGIHFNYSYIWRKWFDEVYHRIPLVVLGQSNVVDDSVERLFFRKYGNLQFRINPKVQSF